MRGPEQRAVQGDSVQVKALGSRTLITIAKGKIAASLAEDAFTTFQHLIQAMTDPVWVIDALQVTGFETRTLTQGARWMTLYRQRGGSHFLLASRWERTIMAARTITLGFGIRVEAFANLELALRAADDLTNDEKKAPGS